MNVILHEPVPVYVAPVNPATQRWGVCAIPWMWRHPDGRLMIMINGNQDTHSPDHRQDVPNLFFASKDNGNTWEPLEQPSSYFPEFTGSEPPYVRLKNGSWINFRLNKNRCPMTDLPPVRKVPSANLEHLCYIYRFGDVPDACIAAEVAVYTPDGVPDRVEPGSIDFPDFALSLIGAAKYTDGKNVMVEEYRPIEELFAPQYHSIQGILELSDGTLAGIMFGQCHSVFDRAYGVIYLVVSEDGGKRWKLRSEIGPYDPELDFGYTYENSLAIAPNGDLLVVMRTEHCVPKEVERMTGVMFARSSDLGHTWTKPTAITDSSVTPHLVTLKNGVLVLVYGRPGVHIRYSTDSGFTWSEPISIIGKTLGEHLAAGDDYMDCKYWNMDTYANTFLYAISNDTVLLLYNDMKYQTGDGLNHKAALVRKITFLRE